MWKKCISITTKYSTWLHIFICTQFCWVISVSVMEYNLINLDWCSIIFYHLSYLCIRQLRSCYLMCSQAIDQNDFIFGNGKNILVYWLTTHYITVYYYLMKYSMYFYLNIPKESNIVIFGFRCWLHEMLVFGRR
jgi:hypothetical protein